MSITELIEKLKRENKAFAKEYERIDLAFEVSEMVFEARCSAGLSQAALAKKVGTKQSSIARIESGASLPSLSFLEKIAKALKLELIPPQFTAPRLDTKNENGVPLYPTRIRTPFAVKMLDKCKSGTAGS